MSLLRSMVSDEKSIIICIVFSLWVMYYFSPTAFNIFLCLQFQKFDSGMSCCRYFFNSLCLWFTQLHECVRMCFAKFEKFLTIISLSAFPFPSFLSSPSVGPRTYNRHFVIIPQVYFLSVVQIAYFLLFYLQLQWFYLCHLNSAAESVLWDFYFQLFSVLKLPFGSFLHLLFLCWNFLYFHLFQVCVQLLVEVFLQWLLANLNQIILTSVISMLPSIDCLFTFDFWFPGAWRGRWFLIETWLSWVL